MSAGHRAAGGVLWLGGKVAVVHRHRYDDWTLPKGKLDQDEAWHDAALREVEEETGWRARLRNPAGTTLYEVGGAAKEVRWWHMDAVEDTGAVPDPDEVAEVVWMTPEEARSRLTYEDERKLLD